MATLKLLRTHYENSGMVLTLTQEQQGKDRRCIVEVLHPVGARWFTSGSLGLAAEPDGKNLAELWKRASQASKVIPPVANATITEMGIEYTNAGKGDAIILHRYEYRGSDCPYYALHSYVIGDDPQEFYPGEMPKDISLQKTGLLKILKQPGKSTKLKPERKQWLHSRPQARWHCLPMPSAVPSIL